jgi:ATP-binding cassette, subfamily B, bacterial PglK
LKSQFEKVWYLLNKRERRQLTLVSVLFTFSGLADMIGIASIFPFLSVAANPEILNSNIYLIEIKNWIQVSNKQLMIFLGLMSLIVLLINQTVRMLSNWYGQLISHRIWWNLERRMFRFYLNQPYLYHLNHSGNSLLEKLQVQTNAAVGGVIQPYFLIISALCSASFTIFLLVWVKPLMTLLLLGVMIMFYFLVYRRLKSRLDYYGKIGPEFSNKSFKLIDEALSAIKEIKVRRNGQIYLDLFDPLAKRYIDSQVKIQLFNDVPRGLVEVVAYGGILLISILMINQNGGIQMVIPILGMYALALSRLLPAVHNIYNQVAQIRFYSPSLHAIQEDLTAAIDSNHKQPKEVFKKNNFKLEQKIELKNLNFSYPGTINKVLDSISLTIPVGTLIGIAGGSGAGKTSLVDLILGLFQPDSGSIQLDGKILDESNLSGWQTNIGYVPQSGFIVDGTIARNIAFGILESEIDMQRVVEVANIAEISEFIENDLPEKYNTLVGDRGVRLSGGQRQRLMIARALYHDPQVLILDEATSALDGITEAKVMRSISEFSIDKTIIVIAHRLTTLRECETIFLFERGKLVDQGNYNQLMKTNSMFYRMTRNSEN